MVQGLIRVLTALLLSCAAVIAGTRAKFSNVSPAIPGRYIVEFEDDQDTGDFSAHVRSLGEHRMQFDYGLFKGASFSYDDPEEAGENLLQLSSMPSVKNIWPVRLSPRPRMRRESLATAATLEKHAKRLAGNASLSTHVMTQVDRLRAEGVTGKGIKLALIDDGIDYVHPALGGCFGEGCLVSFGTDLVGDDFNGTNTPVPDDDPRDTCYGHGTGVAGIIAARADNPYGLVGAATGVTLGIYRVFGCPDGPSSTDVYVDAFLRAHQDGSQIISASLEEDSGWEEGIVSIPEALLYGSQIQSGSKPGSAHELSVVMSRIAEAGVPCIAAAGNAGEAGLFTSPMPATGNKVIAVASVDNSVTPQLDDSSSPPVLTEAANAVSGGFPSIYTAWGPTFEGAVKPQFGAPGFHVLTLAPIDLGSYDVLSGTSMAAPLVSAVFALIAEVRGTLDPAVIQSLLSETANPNLFNDGTTTFPYLAPVTQQGAGLIQAYDAAYATTILNPFALAFNDSDHLVDTMNFTITNTGSTEVTYKLASVGAATVNTFTASNVPDELYDLELEEVYAQIELSDTAVTLPAKGEATISVVVTPPRLSSTRLPVYSGYITLNGTQGESLSLPYHGIAGSLHGVQVLGDAHLSLSTDEDLSPGAGGNSSFVLSRDIDAPADLLPVAVADMMFGSPLVEVAVETADGTSLGNILEGSFPYVSRTSPVGAAWDGRLEDRSFAPAGTYKFAVSALRIFGNADDPAEYDVAYSSTFSISYEEP